MSGNLDMVFRRTPGTNRLRVPDRRPTRSHDRHSSHGANCERTTPTEKEERNMSEQGLRFVLVGLLTATAAGVQAGTTLGPQPGGPTFILAQTEGMERRDDRRQTRQDTRDVRQDERQQNRDERRDRRYGDSGDQGVEETGNVQP
jgi:hypothetical protein